MAKAKWARGRGKERRKVAEGEVERQSSREEDAELDL